MQQVNHPRRDPAPSRIAYRVQRLWLTPYFRTFLRLGLPMLLLAGSVVWFVSQPENRLAVSDKVAEIRRSIEERPEFMVKLMAIDGASEEIAQGIREVLPVEFPISSFDLDLPAMQDQIEELDAVARVDIRVRSGGILQLQIEQRVPAVVWRIDNRLELLDAEGHRVASLRSRLARRDLPLLAGLGADLAVTEALEILVTAEPVFYRIRGLVRMGERRWDIVLDRDQRIMLPEDRPVAALKQIMALEQALELLERDLSVVDMRNPNRPTLRLTPQSQSALRQASDQATGDTH